MSEVRDFWAWVESELPQMESLLTGKRDDALIDAIERRVSTLGGGGLGWEIGPGVASEYQFVLSPKGNRERLRLTRELVRQCPDVPGWEFHPAKPPKEWTERVIELGSLESARVCFDEWDYSLTAFNSREFFDIDLYPPEMVDGPVDAHLDRMAYLLAEGELGEEFLIERIGEIRAHRSPSESENVGSVEHLREHLRSLTAT